MQSRSMKLQEAWLDYCLTNRIIAYGEVPPLSEEEIEERCSKQFEEAIKIAEEEYKDECINDLES